MDNRKTLIEKIIPTLHFKFPYDVDDYAKNLYFENYHCHKDFSNTIVADSGDSIEQYANRCHELNAKCLFSGEHGSQGNQFHVYSVAEKEKLKYRHSTEAYWVKNRFEKDRANCHMVIVAKNPEGRRDINYILSMANIDGYYYRPRIDLDLLLDVPKDNLIITSACFLKGTRVLTNNGYKNIESIKNGDIVVNQYGKLEKVNFPTQIHYCGNGFEISTNAFNRDIKCTSDHKFLTTTMGDVYYNRKPKWNTAKEIYESLSMSNHSRKILLYPLYTDFSYKTVIYKKDFDGVYKNIKHEWSVKQKLKDQIIITPELMRLFGYFIGDGHICINTPNDRIGFSFNIDEYEYYYHDFVSKVENQLGIKFCVFTNKKTHKIELSTSSIDVVNLFYYIFGNCNAGTKHIPNKLLHISYDLDCELLYGMILADGCISKCIRDTYTSYRMTYVTISNVLCEDFRRLCNDLGIYTTKTVSKSHIDKNNVKHCESYYISVSSKILNKINKRQYTSHETLINTIKSLYNFGNRKPRRFIDGVEYLLIKINHMDLIKIDDIVYCLNDNSHSFISEFAIAHNCIAGWNYEDASDMWLKIHEHFQDNFFFELQANNTDPQKRLNEKILYLSDKYGIDIIAGLDSHYINDVGQVKRDQILKYKKVSYPEEIGWYMDYPNAETFLDRFKEQNILSEEQALRAIMNTNIFVDDCEEIVFDRKFKIPSVYKDKTYEEKCKIYKTQLNLAYAKEKNKSKEKVNGIRYEAKEIMDSGVVDYFLTSKKIVEDAVNNEGGILTTTSRGSAASYITNKLIGLTTVDRFNADIPIYPERFLTKERVDAGMMPDIDLNIAEQEPFVRATRKLLGEYGCMPLMAIEKLKKKAAWQLYAGANDVPPATANQISKYIDQYEDAVKYADDEDKELIDVEDYIPSEYIDLFRKSNDYQGITINLKVHACGHLIFDGDIRREIGLISAISKTTGKRTICACVEGGVLDDFGYVKEDFLIVDSVHLIYKCFHAIGKEVPSFEELREMIKDDKATWDIYEKGITCCVNQCEKESTTNKVKKYKPKSLAELSAFIAAIRPGFASLLNKFLSREEYTTGESKIDDLLNDTAHFMLYQESIMKILSFLGMKMGDTYGVIKSISKKKLKGEKKEHLLDELKIDWDKEFHNLNNFMNVWNVIEDSSRYAFNSPHAYSMGGDSAYIAWFKAHYTSVFYETAINHYQGKGKKDKINALIKEAIKFFDYKMGDYEFGKDNRTVTLDVASKIIYPNLSSVKGFGEGVTNSLYEVGQDEYNSFIDVLTALLSVSISKTIIEKLIKINYFKKYGDINTLLKTLKYYDVIYGAKTMSKDKAIKNNIPFELLAKYGHETKSQFNKLDSPKLLQELVSMIPYSKLTLKERLDNQNNILGIINIVEPDVNKRIYYVSDLEIKKTIVNISLYEIYSGKTRSVKMWTSQYNKNPFEKNSILYIHTIEKKNKREPNGEINPVTGKKIYVPVPDKFEYWLSKYVIKNNIEEGE